MPRSCVAAGGRQVQPQPQHRAVQARLLRAALAAQRPRRIARLDHIRHPRRHRRRRLHVAAILDAAGIAASTGGATNIHEIKSLSISSLSFSNLLVSKTSTVISDPINGTTNPKAIPGARVRYCIQVSNVAGNPSATSVVVTDPISSLPVTFIASSIYLGGTVTGGVCNWNGTSGGSYSAGTVTGTLGTLAAGATTTLYFDATVN